MYVDFFIFIYLYSYSFTGHVGRVASDSEGGEAVARQPPAAAHGVDTIHDQWPGAADFGCLFEPGKWCACCG